MPKRVNRICKKISKMGIRPEWLQPEWISAAEGIRFAKKMEKSRRTVTEEEIKECGRNFCGPLKVVILPEWTAYISR